MARYSKNEEVEELVETLRQHISQDDAKSCYENAKKIPKGQRVPLNVNGQMVWISNTKAVKIFADLAGAEE